jgi:hypothetical protein
MRHTARLVAVGAAIALGTILSMGSAVHAGEPGTGTDGTRVTGADSHLHEIATAVPADREL